jgi:hypothetical protein
MHPVVRSCLLISVELGLLLGAGLLACLRGRRLLCTALLILALSPLLTLVLEIVTNTYRPLQVPDFAYVLRLPSYIRMIGCVVLLSAISKLPKGPADSD